MLIPSSIFFALTSFCITDASGFALRLAALNQIQNQNQNKASSKTKLTSKSRSLSGTSSSSNFFGSSSVTTDSISSDSSGAQECMCDCCLSQVQDQGQADGVEYENGYECAASFALSLSSVATSKLVPEICVKNSMCISTITNTDSGEESKITDDYAKFCVDNCAPANFDKKVNMQCLPRDDPQAASRVKAVLTGTPSKKTDAADSSVSSSEESDDTDELTKYDDTVLMKELSKDDIDVMIGKKRKRNPNVSNIKKSSKTSGSNINPNKKIALQEKLRLSLGSSNKPSNKLKSQKLNNLNQVQVGQKLNQNQSQPESDSDSAESEESDSEVEIDPAKVKSGENRLLNEGSLTDDMKNTIDNSPKMGDGSLSLDEAKQLEARAYEFAEKAGRAANMARHGVEEIVKTAVDQGTSVAVASKVELEKFERLLATSAKHIHDNKEKKALEDAEKARNAVMAEANNRAAALRNDYEILQKQEDEYERAAEQRNDAKKEWEVMQLKQKMSHTDGPLDGSSSQMIGPNAADQINILANQQEMLEKQAAAIQKEANGYREEAEFYGNNVDKIGEIGRTEVLKELLR